MGGIVYSFTFIAFNIYLKLVVQVLSGIVIYIMLSIATRNSSWKYILNFIRTRLRKKDKEKENAESEQ